ncbi:hypothetical protein TPY_0013 [Sulfobacillus acidophilus TPY]|nr:hypothetical protein TPY_0013 [Sulfobacillus acidophilus TPY]
MGWFSFEDLSTYFLVRATRVFAWVEKSTKHHARVVTQKSTTRSPL